MDLFIKDGGIYNKNKGIQLNYYQWILLIVMDFN